MARVVRSVVYAAAMAGSDLPGLCQEIGVSLHECAHVAWNRYMKQAARKPGPSCVVIKSSSVMLRSTGALPDRVDTTARDQLLQFPQPGGIPDAIASTAAFQHRSTCPPAAC
mmetsp:Transcript_13034/g.37895  ORF Transcript_13034/g.37895 Transcript_13034/m.37895 type:complete len:112 (-) Transcript_13034:809-1144(-)